MDIRVNPFLFRFPLCQHVLFAHQTVRAMPLLHLTSAAHADEASLSFLLFALFSVLNAWQYEKIFVILYPHTEIPS